MRDKDDTYFIAVCLALKTDGIWSDDSHFIDNEEVRIFGACVCLGLNYEQL